MHELPTKTYDGQRIFLLVQEEQETFRNILDVSGKSDILLSLQRTPWVFLDTGTNVPLTDSAQVIA